MDLATSKRVGSIRLQSLWPVLLAAVLVALVFLTEGRIDINLLDEGYLWYGTLRTAAGELPVLDFRSYDPARYWWTSLGISLFGGDILGLRLSVTIFQFVGLSVGLLIMRRVVRNPVYLMLVAILMIVWMIPRHKIFEITMSLINVWVIVLFIESPTARRHFLMGVYAGFAGVMNRNLALYAVLSTGLVMLLVWIKLRPGNVFRLGGAWVLGGLTGYLSMFVLFLIIPDFFQYYIQEKVLIFAERGETNLPKPIPWPWTADYALDAPVESASRFILGVNYVLLPLFCLAVLIWTLVTTPQNFKRHSVIVGGAAVGLFFLHHAFARSGGGRLAQAIQPILLASVALMAALPRRYPLGWARAAVLAFLVMSLLVPFVSRPLGQWMLHPENYVRYELNGDWLILPINKESHIATLETFFQERLPADETVYVAPLNPGLYPILERTAPVHDTFPLFPESADAQAQTIRDLSGVNWAVIQDFPLDGRDDLRFRNTHPLVWAYIEESFEPHDLPGLMWNTTVYERKTNGD